jgi:hypothetical protein
MILETAASVIPRCTFSIGRASLPQAVSIVASTVSTTTSARVTTLTPYPPTRNLTSKAAGGYAVKALHVRQLHQRVGNLPCAAPCLPFCRRLAVPPAGIEPAHAV